MRGACPDGLAKVARRPSLTAAAHGVLPKVVRRRAQYAQRIAPQAPEVAVSARGSPFARKGAKHRAYCALRSHARTMHKSLTYSP